MRQKDANLGSFPRRTVGYLPSGAHHNSHDFAEPLEQSSSNLGQTGVRIMLR